MSLFKSGFGTPDPEENPLPEEEEAVLDKLARWVVKKSMAVPAIVFCESVKPLNYIGSHGMVFFEPMVQTIFSIKDYDTLRLALEKRQSLEILIQKIEAYDAVAYQKEKRIKKYIRAEKKNWRWYQRWLGVARPRIEIPEEILNPPEDAGEDKTEKDSPE